ncbi:hypothetical protein RhiJN_18933 [Ceratobasidium sp. AG-Ba]|nr:hypothetical protein RhiJN_18933 [Ceratobasidium sp. AG-Ba]
MPPKRHPHPDSQANPPRGRHFGGGNRQNNRGGRARRYKHTPIQGAVGEPTNTVGEHPLSHCSWGEVNPSGWGAEQNSGWAQADDDWVMEAYTGLKIEAWIQQVEACRTCDTVRPPSAMSDGGTTSSTQPINSTEAIPNLSTHQVDPQRKLTKQNSSILYPDTSRTAVSADRKRRALEFLSQSRQQQFETIYALLQELRNR